MVLRGQPRGRVGRRQPSSVALLLQDEQVGLVQTRWGHLNDTLSLLTRAQAVALDGHFLVEQMARDAHGAFKRQQFRWAKGSIQVARLILPTLWRSPHPLRVKLAATLHLTGYSVHPAMLLLLLLSLPLMLAGWPVPAGMPPIWLSTLGMSAPLLYAVAQYDGYPHTWKRRLLWLPLLMALGLGMALNNTPDDWVCIHDRARQEHTFRDVVRMLCTGG